MHAPIIVFSVLCSLLLAEGTTASALALRADPAEPKKFEWKATKGAVVTITNYRKDKKMVAVDGVDFTVPGLASTRSLQFEAGPNADGSIGFKLKGAASDPWTGKPAENPALVVGTGQFDAQIGPDLIKCHLQPLPQSTLQWSTINPLPQTILFQNTGDRKVYKFPCEDFPSWVRVICGGPDNGGGASTVCDPSQWLVKQ